MLTTRRHMVMHLFTRVVSLVTVCVLVSSCGLLSASEDDLPLDGREFWSTAVLQNGEPITLAEGTRIKIGFGEERINASAGCNSMSGSFDIEADRLVTEDLAQTEMGCDPERHAQDEMLMQLFGAEPIVVLSGDELELRSDLLTVRLVDASVANPDRSLVDTTWEVDGFSRGQTAMAISTPRRASFVLGSDNTVRGTDGCQEIDANVVIDGTMLRFADVVRDADDVCENQEYVDEFYDSIVAPLSWSITGDVLNLIDADGVGFTARAVDG